MRLYNNGAEFNDMLFWDGSVGEFLPTDWTCRSGIYSYYGKSGAYAWKNTIDLSTFYFRFGFYYDLYSNSMTPRYIGSWKHDSTILGGLFVGSADTRLLSLYTGSTTVASDAYLSSYTWYLIEAYVDISDAGHVTLKVDGRQCLDYSGDTKPGTDTHINNICHRTPFDLWYAYFDDLALNDTDNSDGKNDNSWCMDGHYEAHFANDNGDSSQWTGNDGDKVNNFALVDEVPHDGDTTYVKSNTPGEQDMYKVTDYTPTNKIITRIYSECRAKDSPASSSKIKIGFKTDGTVYLCSADRTLTGDYARVVGDDAKVNPFDSGIWEDADIDAIQFVGESE